MPAEPLDATAVHAALSQRDARMLSAVLTAAEVAHDGASEPATELADKLVRALWWRSHSPVGQLVVPDDLGAMVDRTAARLSVGLPEDEDAWARLAALTDALVPSNQPLDLDALPEDDRKRLRRGIAGQVAGWTGVGAAAGGRWASIRLMGLLQGPLWDLLVLLPRVGPGLVKVKGAAGVVASVSGPLGVGIALATLNHALGPRHDRALPLLVGAGLVMRNPLAPISPD